MLLQMEMEIFTFPTGEFLQDITSSFKRAHQPGPASQVQAALSISGYDKCVKFLK